MINYCCVYNTMMIIYDTKVDIVIGDNESVLNSIKND